MTNGHKQIAAGLFTLAVTTAAAARAADWPQFRGPSGDGTTPEIITPWPASGPKEVWRVPVGEGLGPMVVAGKRAFLFASRDQSGAKREACVALDADSGKELWAADIDRPADDKTYNNGGPIPRSAPAVDGDKVYVLGSHLKLVCLNAGSGKVVWQHDLMREYAGRNISWDNAASPLVEGGKVFVAGGGAGQSLLAFDAATGKVAWKTGDEKITHAGPVPATIHGVRQILFYVQSGLVAVRPADGRVLWRFKFPFNVSTASSPVVGGKDGEVVYCSAGYKTGSAVCKVTKSGDTFAAVPLWKVPDENENVNHWTTPVYHDGHLFGIFGFKKWGTAPLKCVELSAAAKEWTEAWSRPGYGSGGGTILAGNLLVVQSDTGRLGLVEAKPDGAREVASAQVFHATPPYGPNFPGSEDDLRRSPPERCWSMAVVAGGRIYAKSTKEAVCLDVSGK